jgi:hypothetical protein
VSIVDDAAVIRREMLRLRIEAGTSTVAENEEWLQSELHSELGKLLAWSLPPSPAKESTAVTEGAHKCFVPCSCVWLRRVPGETVEQFEARRLATLNVADSGSRT